MRMFPGNEKTPGHSVINYISHVFEMHTYEQSREASRDPARGTPTMTRFCFLNLRFLVHYRLRYI